MIEIKDLLINFEKLLGDKGIRKDIISNILFETVGLKIKTEDIEIKNGTLFLNAKPIYKNEIFIKRDLILEKIKQSLNGGHPKDVR